MAWSEENINRNREYFAKKLQAYKQRNDVLVAVQNNSMDFILLDTRTREGFSAGHIPGAWCAPLTEIDSVIPQLPKDREIVTYCWGHD
jgi:rhodanese-related sulfurtransferase